MKKYRLDKTCFQISSFQAASYTRAYWLSQSPKERLQAAWYLTCCAYNLNREHIPPLDKTVFSMRKTSC
jgi:hypothetical protein